MIRIKNIVMFSLLGAFSFNNASEVNILNIDDSFCGMEATSSPIENTPEPISVGSNPNLVYESFTTEYEGQKAFVESYFNHETKDFIYNVTIIQHELPLEEKLLFTSESGPEINTSSAVNTGQESDYFKDFTQDQRQEVLEELEEQKLEEKRQESGLNQDIYIPKNRNIIREQDFPIGKKLYLGDDRKFDSEIILNNVHTLKDLSNVLSSPIVQARFTRIKYDLESKPVRRGRRGIEHNHKSELVFLNALLSGKVAQLINDIQHAPLAIAGSSFNELKSLWPWKRDHTFLIPSLTYGTGEPGFIVTLGLDIMRITERDFITRPDYIQAHMDESSLTVVQQCKEQCVLLQQKNDTKALFNEVKQELFYRVLNNGKQGNLADTICFAIAEKAVLDPINIVLGRIKHARSLEAARKELHNLEIQVLNYAKRENLTRMSDITARLIEQYGFDLLQIAEEIYRARHDYVHTEHNQTILSDSVQTILGNIKHNKLSSAHRELVSVNQQIADAFKVRNITDPVEQQEHLVKDFGADLRVLTKSTYQERPDFMNLIKLFTPLDVPSITIDILNNNNDYESVANEFDKVAEQVLDNARLCDLDYIPQVENQLVQSLQIMRSPQNQVEFVFHATVADHLMTDLQCHADAIAKAEHIVRERSLALLVRAFEKFIAGLNPIEQAKSMASLAQDAGHLVSASCSIAKNAVLHPIDTVNSIRTINTNVCEFLINTARFASDITIGKFYLSPEEHQIRIDGFKEALNDMPLAHLTAEHWVDLTAQIAADFFFCKGIAGVYHYVKEIEAISKIQKQAGRVAEALKRAVDTHLADNPVLVTPEGIVLKMSNNMHTPPGGPRNVINNSKALLESVYAPIASQLAEEIKAIRQIKLPHGFNEFGHKPIRIAYEHILGMDINKHKLDFKGFHHDYKNSIKKSNLLKFTNQIMNEHGCYKADLLLDSLRIPGKTFFPSDWSREQVINKIYEAYDNFKNSGKVAELNAKGKYKIRGFTQEGIEIEMCFTIAGEMKTAYPILP